MASIHKEFVVDATPDAVWDVLSDYGAVHERLAPGFVTDTHLSSDTRTVTFMDRTIVHERLVDLDHENRRVAYRRTTRPVRRGASAEDPDQGGVVPMQALRGRA
ncbi:MULTISPECIES: SRPBCC family protein [unclassified Streptomyces]|uniref:SRPBCC family protein n=1 Tax=unclassified Streptomyces TaxID=2593676 RepID=UPI00336AC69F